MYFGSMKSETSTTFLLLPAPSSDFQNGPRHGNTGSWTIMDDIDHIDWGGALLANLSFVIRAHYFNLCDMRCVLRRKKVACVLQT
jgi:hypothetical protein